MHISSPTLRLIVYFSGRWPGCTRYTTAKLERDGCRKKYVIKKQLGAQIQPGEGSRGGRHASSALGSGAAAEMIFLGAAAESCPAELDQQLHPPHDDPYMYACV